MTRLFITDRELDSAGYAMADALARRGDFRVFIGVSSDETGRQLPPSCTPREMPPINSKVDLRAVRALRSHFRGDKIDTVFSMSTSGLACGLWASPGLQVRNVGFRGTERPVLWRDPSNLLALLNPRVSGVAVVNEDIRQALARHIPSSRIVTTFLPFEEKWVENALARPLLPPGYEPKEGDYRIMMIGNTRGRPYKGLRDLIEAVLMLEDPTCVLTVIGDYDPSDYELAMSGGQGGSRFCFTGPLRDAYRYLPTQHLYVLPSWREAWGRVLREATACGVPCVITPLTGPRVLIRDGFSGLEVPRHDPESLAEAIKTMRANPELGRLFAQNALDEMRRTHSMEAFLERITPLLVSGKS